APGLLVVRVLIVRLVLVEDLDFGLALALFGGVEPQRAAVGAEELQEVFQATQLDEPLVLAGPGPGLGPARRPLAGRRLRDGAPRRPAHPELHRRPPFCGWGVILTAGTAGVHVRPRAGAGPGQRRRASMVLRARVRISWLMIPA